jgi:hypothetical protein
VELLFVIIWLKTSNFIVSICECDGINTYFIFGPIIYHKEYMYSIEIQY